ncbi:MAG: hypothetical protein ABIO92_03395 [Chloroflexia bacterium]
MATRDKRSRWSWRGRSRKKASVALSEAKASAEKKPEAEAAIKKGIYLSALVYIEGEQAAPADFATTATTALKEKLRAAFGEEGNLGMTLKKVEVRNDIEEEDDAEGEEKFQF